MVGSKSKLRMNCYKVFLFSFFLGFKQLWLHHVTFKFWNINNCLLSIDWFRRRCCFHADKAVWNNQHNTCMVNKPQWDDGIRRWMMATGKEFSHTTFSYRSSWRWIPSGVSELNLYGETFPSQFLLFKIAGLPNNWLSSWGCLNPMPHLIQVWLTQVSIKRSIPLVSYLMCSNLTAVTG